MHITMTIPMSNKASFIISPPYNRRNSVSDPLYFIILYHLSRYDSTITEAVFIISKFAGHFFRLYVIMILYLAKLLRRETLII